ncbi:MAG: hypothetical protein H8E14_00155, partial [Candidatus Marinimicrobia bacterium]|nr:hypothetical protein [Candidatus Neomarinimicrobiota bacterium]
MLSNVSSSRLKVIAIIGLVWLNTGEKVRAVPRFAVDNGYSCNLCHVNPSGGGLRNDYGSSIYGANELVMDRNKKFSRDNWDGFVNDYLRVGGDIRFQVFSHVDTVGRKTAIFPMQADLQTEIMINARSSLYLDLDLSGNSDPEFWTMIFFGGENWLRFGKALPDYGLKTDDHTAFIRGGNLRQRYLKTTTEGLFFNPYIKLPAMVEIGIPFKENLVFIVSTGNAFIKGTDPDYGFTDMWENKYRSLGLDYFTQFNRDINIYGGLNWLVEEELSFQSISGGINFRRITWIFEYDRAENWNSERSLSFSTFHQFGYKIFTGINLITEYQFYDPEIDFTSGAISRTTIGLELFPLNILEI